MIFRGNLVDAINSEIYPAKVVVENGIIKEILPLTEKQENFIIPGFIDAHVHVESSMLVPSEFAKAAIIHGTVATVSDPHEIANVLGIDGVRFMIENSKTVPLKFNFGAPSCVPASPFEISGATLGPEEVEELLKSEDIKYLAEVMNFPGVINRFPDVMEKIDAAKKYSKPIDGHAPGLSGEDLKKYVDTGISTDHESLNKEEALEKIKLGMKILIREGSAAKDFEEMISLADGYSDSLMFCSDDKHPDDLVAGHINKMVKRAVDKGIDPMKVLKIACINPVLHYDLEVGLLGKGDSADFLVVSDLNEFKILKTIINGEIVAENGQSMIVSETFEAINKFVTQKKEPNDFRLTAEKPKINVIEAIDGQLYTEITTVDAKLEGENVVSDIEKDILKITVVNRYQDAKPAVGFVKNFGLKRGAIAGSVAHDSHNIIAVGVSDEEICRAVNLVIENKGGVCGFCENEEVILPLPVAGLMSANNYKIVAEKYIEVDRMAKSLGSKLHSPFMTLSFMALLVIPNIKLSDKGLFDSQKFEFIDVFSD